MKREIVSHCFLGALVKLTPQGKVYKVHTVIPHFDKIGRGIELHDAQGKIKNVSWGTSVYVVSEHPEIK